MYILDRFSHDVDHLGLVVKKKQRAATHVLGVYDRQVYLTLKAPATFRSRRQFQILLLFQK